MGDRFRFEAIGSQWQIDVATELSEAARSTVIDRVADFDQTWSRFRPDSIVAGLREPPYEAELPEEADRLLALYDHLHRLTDGAINPLVGESLEHLGYGPGYRLVADQGWRPAPEWGSVNWRSPVLRAAAPVVLDVGAAGKGLLVQILADLVTNLVAGPAVVDGSGDLVNTGPAIRVGLEHPADSTRAVGVAELASAALCASATNRRAWGPGMHHMVDARSGRPVYDVVATWVISDDAMVADGLCTALFFVSPERLQDEFEFEWVRFTAHGLEHSAGWPGEVFA